MRKEEILYLGQLFEILEDKIKRLKESYENKEVLKFNSLKKEIIQIHEKISETIK
ncbi:MAG: hypothetical protein WC812_03015 [Candidatus Pacearchaeota archaeon]|jgi:hypothetical protein